MQKMTEGSQRDGTKGKVLAYWPYFNTRKLYLVSLTVPGVLPEHKAKSKPWVLPRYVPHPTQKKKKIEKRGLEEQFSGLEPLQAESHQVHPGASTGTERDAGN